MIQEDDVCTCVPHKSASFRAGDMVGDTVSTLGTPLTHTRWLIIICYTVILMLMHKVVVNPNKNMTVIQLISSSLGIVLKASWNQCTTIS